jgi:dTDP-4-amino-4,6-dideoxygalactose transaminase
VCAAVIRLSEVHVDQESESLLLEAVRSGRLAQGPMVARLEREFAPLCGCEHVVAVANGTVALVAALEALGIGPGDEVVTTPFTFVATVNAALQLGASVRFADVCESDFCLDPGALAGRLTERTAAVIRVHLYGQMADMDGIQQVASRAGAPVVEDAAQAHGAGYCGRPAGSIGAVGIFSLYATKNVTAGEGGLVCTNDAELADKLLLLRNQGMRARYEYVGIGHNWRLTEMQAAVAIPQLAKLREMNARRTANACRLSEGLEGVPGLRTPATLPGREHVWHQYTVCVTEEARLSRDQLMESLRAAGIESGVYYPRPIYSYQPYREHPAVDHEPMPQTERLCAQVLSLPVHPWLKPGDTDQIVDAVRRLLDA